MTPSTVLRFVQRCKKSRVPERVVFLSLVLVRAADGAAQDPLAPSPIEHALVEYLCRTVQQPPVIGTEVYQACYSSQLATLRESFGRDLAKLTAADRKTLDSSCGEMQVAGRDAYVACLYAQLMVIRDKRSRGKPPQSSAAVTPPPVVEPPTPAEMPVPMPVPPPASRRAMWWVAAGVAAAAAAGAVGFVYMRGKRPAPGCRGCGAAIATAGDLCANCRHDAAEARRRAVADRAEEARLADERAKRERERIEEEQRSAAARQEEELRRRAEREQRQREDRERRLARAIGEDPAAHREDVFNPYTILGVSPDATADAIRAAYEAAKAKYDPREYEHLGHELQEHFRTKAAAVERAYQMLAIN
jgi:hypothetical protein